MNAAASPGPAGPVPLRAVLLNGSVGAGKTTVANAMWQHLSAAGIPGAVIDLDQLRSCWPAPADDPFNNEIMYENLAAVAATYHRHGRTTLVLAGVVESGSERGSYHRATGVEPTLVRLTASVAELQRRVTLRSATPAERDWHVARAPQLHAILERAALDDHVVVNDGVDPDEVAARVIALLGW